MLHRVAWLERKVITPSQPLVVLERSEVGHTAYLPHGRNQRAREMVPRPRLVICSTAAQYSGLPSLHRQTAPSTDCDWCRTLTRPLWAAAPWPTLSP